MLESERNGIFDFMYDNKSVYIRSAVEHVGKTFRKENGQSGRFRTCLILHLFSGHCSNMVDNRTVR